MANSFTRARSWRNASRYVNMSERVQSAGERIIELLASIPAEELVQCARENLRATKITRTTRGQKDPETGERLPDTVQEPDFVTRQKALEWISAQLAGTPDKRPPPVKDKAGDDPGKLRARDRG